MKQWLSKLIISILIFSLMLISCNKTKVIVFKGNADELISQSKENTLIAFDKNSIIEVEGIVAWIFYPKDGFNLDRCSIYLGTEGCDTRNFKGNFISCKIKKRISQDQIGKRIIIRGCFDETFEAPEYYTFSIKNCEIIDNFSSIE